MAEKNGDIEKEMKKNHNVIKDNIVVEKGEWNEEMKQVFDPSRYTLVGQITGKWYYAGEAFPIR